MATSLSKSLFAGRLDKFRQPGLKEQGAFLLRLAEMLDNGFTLLESLRFLERLEKRKYIDIEEMTKDLQAGLPIHEVFARQRFDSQACTQLFFAGQHGFLADALFGAGMYIQKKTEEKSKFIKLIQYPLLLLVIMIGAGGLLKGVLYPRFRELYSSMGYAPDGKTDLLLHIMNHLPAYIGGAAAFIGLTIMAGHLYLRRLTAIEKADLLASIPFYSTTYRLIQTIFLAREWSYLLKSGFSLNELIAIMEKQAFRPLLKESAEEMRALLIVGCSFSEALAGMKFLEKEMGIIIAHGEQNGKLADELLYYSEMCIQRLEDRTERLFTLLQPLIFALIGLFVVAIYLSILMPMFRMLETI